ncbi:MAG: S8 family peptidase [Magnetococcales bacterium]|nr:S8 family peptidase [Magnetococcales bacterium]MBF0114043.1 S8 family peptidase [Magnetococcales bacterium]
MTERPLLILPEPSSAARAKPSGGGGGPKPLGPDRQKQRLGPRLAELEAAFEAQRLTMQTTAAGLAPEQVLVLETAGTVEDFFKAVKLVEGFEFLAEFDEEGIPPDDDFFVEKKGVKTGYRGRVYLMFANQQAFRQLLNLWGIWQRREEFNKSLKKFANWRNVFALLRDIRPWSVRDRLEETGVLEDWKSRLEWEREKLPCEIELWFRSDEQQRIAAAAQVRARILELGGEVVSEAVIREIYYHALAVRLPIAAIQTLLDTDRRNSVALVQAEQIQFFRASGQMAGRVTVDQVAPLAQRLDAPLPDPASQPVVALLDGLPLQSHRALDGRLSVEDPDDFGANYEARFRLHGTAMASLIIWGDLHAPGESIPQPLYVRPIMQPFAQPEWVTNPPEERVPEGILIVDLIHRAVRRMFEGDGSEPPSAPNVAVINLSIGIADRPFDGTMSPLAKLLDWLSWKYDVLFLVSAGNHGMPVGLGQPWSALATASTEEICEQITKAIAAETRHRRLLSPAEGMNVLTVGATHEDHDPATVHPNRIDPTKPGFPSPVNAQGQGYKRSIKPDIFAPGGRVAFERPLLDTAMELALPRVAYAPGQLVAIPGPTPGDVTATVPIRGTSNATAIMSRAAAFLAPMLDELREMEGGYILDQVPGAAWLKTLLVHGARWGEPGATYQKLFRTPDNGNKLPEQLTRFLGYGRVDQDAVCACTASRVTMLAGGKLAVNTGVEHRFPLPPSLSGQRGWRSLAITLTWMTPIQPLNHRWRQAHLWFTTPKSKLAVGSDKLLKRNITAWKAVQRGTVQHEVFEGEEVAAFVDGDEVIIHVSCREDAKGLAGSVPYALAITLEVDAAIGIDIYTEIRARVLSKVRIAAESDFT